MSALFHNGGQVPLLATSSVGVISSCAALPSLVIPLYTSPSASVFLPTPVVVPPVHSSAVTTIDQDPIHDQASTDQQLLPVISKLTVTGSDNLSPASPMSRAHQVGVAISSVFVSLFTFSQIYQHTLFEKITPPSERLEESGWVASSKSWLDRSACQWFGICGFSHLWQSGWTNIRQLPLREGDAGKVLIDPVNFWTSGDEDPSIWPDEERRLREIPQFVLDYAPLIHLYSGEDYWPCDIADHIIHTTAHLNYTPLRATSDHPNLTSLDDLNNWGPYVFLQSDDNVEEHPDWLGGEQNIPSSPGGSDDDDDDDDDKDEGKDYYAGRRRPSRYKFYDDEDDPWYEVGIGSTLDLGGDRLDPNAESQVKPEDTAEGEGFARWRIHEPRHPAGQQRRGGRSDAPAVLVVVDKGSGVVDAFWFFFYSFNLGNSVLNIRAGNHVGDWEHTVVRFYKGEPKAVFFSEHSFGEAYAYTALEKLGKRPIGYSATGTHAMYATPGEHPYILPYGMLKDVTDRGPLWDPLLNVHSFTYDYKTDHIRSSNFTPKAPTGWFNFIGHWGDKFYPLSDPRQYRIFGQYHYVNGPLGPRFKNLGRKTVCQGNGDCVIKHWIGDTNLKARRWDGPGEGETMSGEDLHQLFPNGIPQL